MCAKNIVVLSNRERHESSNVLYVIDLNDNDYVLYVSMKKSEPSSMGDYGTVRGSLLLDSIDFQLMLFCNAMSPIGTTVCYFVIPRVDLSLSKAA